MILDYALEKFPHSAKLRDGTAVVVRPLAKRDAGRLHKFFLAVPGGGAAVHQAADF